MVKAFIGLGSNLGDRGGMLKSAVEMLGSTVGIVVIRTANPIETAPLGPPQPDYLNSVCEVETSLSPDELLACCNRIEKSLGRDRDQEIHWGPRTIDLDILLYGDRIIEKDGLVIPHPGMHRRWFALEPLAEIAVGAVHPKFKKTVGELLAELNAKNAT